MNPLIQAMLQAFANNFTFYLKSHNFHWTVMGPDFPQYHELLEEIYGDAQESIDAYAEQLRRLGAFPQGDYRDIVNNSELVDPPETVTDPMQMFTNLLSDLDIIVLRLQDNFDMATGSREYGLQNFLADRIDTHRKQQWMLNAILSVNPVAAQTAATGEHPSLANSTQEEKLAHIQGMLMEGYSNEEIMALHPEVTVQDIIDAAAQAAMAN